MTITPKREDRTMPTYRQSDYPTAHIPTKYDLFTAETAHVPLNIADRDDKLRHRGNLAGILCDHYNSVSYSIIGCDDCWDHAYGPCRYGSCCS